MPFDRKAWMKKYHKVAYQKDRVRLDEINRKWTIDHPIERKTIANRYASSMRGQYNSLKQSSKRRNIELTISYEQFGVIRTGPCFYCGLELPKTGSGLDRIDSDRPYEPNNVRPCCTNCNYAKRRFSTKEFFELVRRIYEKHFTK